MINLAPGTKVYLACRPVDMRAGFNGLAAKVQQLLGRNPFDGQLYLFRGKRGQRTTFYIQFAVCTDRLSLASTLWPRAPSIALSAREGAEVYLYRRTS